MFIEAGEIMAIFHRRALRTVLAAVVLLAVLCGQALAGSIPCYINSNTKVYNAPTTSAASLNVPSGLPVYMTYCNDSWALVNYRGNYACIPLNKLMLASPIVGYAATDVPLYSRPSSSSSRIMTIPYGTTVYVYGRDGSYFFIANADRSIGGYARISQLTPNRPAPRPVAAPAAPSTQVTNPLMSTTTRYYSGMSNSQKLEYVIYVAQTLNGRPYSSSPNVPSSFDCSRFVRHCFQQIGVTLSPVAEDQGYDSRFTAITSISALRRGDVVCFNTNSGDNDLSDHTGIYLGYGYFVHASSSAGKVVVSCLSSGYYADAFTCGRRILQG